MIKMIKKNQNYQIFQDHIFFLYIFWNLPSLLPAILLLRLALHSHYRCCSIQKWWDFERFWPKKLVLFFLLAVFPFQKARLNNPLDSITLDATILKLWWWMESHNQMFVFWNDWWTLLLDRSKTWLVKAILALFSIISRIIHWQFEDTFWGE